MFTSKTQLAESMGVDMEIATFFVDRKVPTNNQYWKGRYLYVASGTGYLFIPLFFDLQFKLGIPKTIVLNEAYVNLTEQILDSAAQHEFDIITFTQHLENCKQLLKGKIKNEQLYSDLLNYFEKYSLEPYKNLGTKSKALNRGDTFLFSLCFLEASVKEIEKIIVNWYALVPSFLLMDDVMDLKEDQKKNQENSLVDFGEGSEGVRNAITFLEKSFTILETCNLLLAAYFKKNLQQKLQTAYLQSLLNTR